MNTSKIRFRAWDGKRMIHNPVIGFTEGKYSYSINDEFSDPYEGYVYMQRTGLVDRNGKDIYEGDIVSVGVVEGEISWFDLGYKSQHQVSIRPRTHPFVGLSMETQKYSYVFEIIGNIYDQEQSK